MSDQITMNGNIANKANTKYKETQSQSQSHRNVSNIMETCASGYEHTNPTSVNFINGNIDSGVNSDTNSMSSMPSLSGATYQRMPATVTCTPVCDSDSIVNSKMPVSELQELCLSRNFASPEYNVLRIEGPSHSPIFTVQAVIRGLISCEAQAKTKKSAKHFAATNALNELRKHPKLTAPDLQESMINQFDKLKISNELRATNSDDNSVDSYDSCAINSSNNPIGLVQEICAKNSLKLPEYKNSPPTGPSHDPIFCVTCKINFENEDIVVKGTARTKQMAKRSAAEQALKCLQLKELNASASTNRNRTKSKSHSSNNSNNSQKNEIDETMEFFESLDSELSNSLEELFEPNAVNKNYCMHLDRIAQRLDCTVEYIEFNEEISKSKKIKCLLQFKKISSKCDRISIFTSWGHSFENIEQAKQNAARKAIIMVKVLKMD